MKRVAVTSDTKGKIRKMIEGVVYSDPRVFVTEFMQNTYRAKAKRLYIDTDAEKGEVSFTDDGVGLKKVEALTVLDYSTWESTSEGFGLGFWSWLGYKDGEKTDAPLECIVESGNTRMRVARERLLRGNTDIDVEKIEKSEGFSVVLKGEILKKEGELDVLERRIRKDGAPMPYDVYLNGELLRKEDIQKKAKGMYTKHFSTRLFDGTLSIGKSNWGVEVYYEKRKVSEIYAGLEVGGVIELKKGALTLKEPDRKDYVYDDKFFKLKDRLMRCQKEIYKDFVKEAENKEIDEVAENIAKVLDVKDYIEFLKLEKSALYNTEEIRECISEGMVSPADGANACFKGCFSDTVLVESHTEDDSVTEQNITGSERRESHRARLIDEVKAEKCKVWVGVWEIDEYADRVEKAEYYDVRVFAAKNKLYMKAFESLKVPHIGQMEGGVLKVNRKRNVRVKNEKEKRVLQLLQIACNYYNLPLSTFKIGDLELTIETKLGKQTVSKEIQKNTKTDIKVRGVAEGESITLDRTALDLERFGLYKGEGFGIEDYKMILALLPVVSHELAHVLYGTKDNTVDHYRKQEGILESLERVYNTAM